MHFRETPLRGAFLIEPERRSDLRGYFARTWCAAEFEKHGIAAQWVQCNTSFNARKGTLRGLHFQAVPHAEAKLIRCTRGAIYDVLVDLRPKSETFGKWFAAELTETNGRAHFAPEGFAHGFQTLTDDAEVHYQMSAAYEASAARGVRWDDPTLNITWPEGIRIIAEKDMSLPLLDPASRTIAEEMEAHYSRTFAEHGPTSRGVDWGAEEGTRLRYDVMLDVIPPGERAKNPLVSLLDVGCGYGALLAHASQSGYDLEYTGIDLSESMTDHGRRQFPEAMFIRGDVLNYEFAASFDFVVCNGILTQKLSSSIMDMDRYAQRLVKRMFGLCRKGIAFNVMTTKVNFTAPNLYYRNPAELLAYCMAEITPRVRLNHAYPLYEYTLYLYREGA